MTLGVGEPGPAGSLMGRGGGSFRGERVVGGSGAEIESRDAGRGLVIRLRGPRPGSPSVNFGFFGLLAFLGEAFGRGEVREPGPRNGNRDLEF